MSFPQKQMSIHEVWNQFACHYQNGPRREINLRTLKTLERRDRKTMRRGVERKMILERSYLLGDASPGDQKEERERGERENMTQERKSRVTPFSSSSSFSFTQTTNKTERGEKVIGSPPISNWGPSSSLSFYRGGSVHFRRTWGRAMRKNKHEASENKTKPNKKKKPSEGKQRRRKRERETQPLSSSPPLLRLIYLYVCCHC